MAFEWDVNGVFFQLLEIKLNPKIIFLLMSLYCFILYVIGQENIKSQQIIRNVTANDSVKVIFQSHPAAQNLRA